MTPRTHWPRIFHTNGRPLRDGEDTISTISVVAYAVRTAAEELVAQPAPNPQWWSGLGGACAVTATAIVLLLKRRGIASTLVLGEYDDVTHCWVELSDGGRIDVTATQFDPDLDDVYWTQPNDDQLYVPEHRGPDARSEIKGWPDTSRWVRRVTKRAEKLIANTAEAPWAA